MTVTTSRHVDGAVVTALCLAGTLTVEQIYQDRDKFAQLVREVAAPDVGRMGIEILSFTIKVREEEEGLPHFSPLHDLQIVSCACGVSLLAGCVRSRGVPELSRENPDGCSEEGRRHRCGRSREGRRHQGRKKYKPLPCNSHRAAPHAHDCRWPPTGSWMQERDDGRQVSCWHKNGRLQTRAGDAEGLLQPGSQY